MKIRNEADRKAFIAEIYAAPIGTEYEKADKAMTGKQRGALHIWCDMMADILNAAGLDMKVVLAHQADIPWSMISFKEHIWKKTLKAMSDKDSTEDQSTVDPGDVYTVLARYFGQEMGVTVPAWPSRRG